MRGPGGGRREISQEKVLTLSGFRDKVVELVHDRVADRPDSVLA